MLVKVKSIGEFGESVVTALAETEDGQIISFAGSWREMIIIAEALDENKEPEVEIESWQILN